MIFTNLFNQLNEEKMSLEEEKFGLEEDNEDLGYNLQFATKKEAVSIRAEIIKNSKQIKALEDELAQIIVDMVDEIV